MHFFQQNRVGEMLKGPQITPIVIIIIVINRYRYYYDYHYYHYYDHFYSIETNAFLNLRCILQFDQKTFHLHCEVSIPAFWVPYPEKIKIHVQPGLTELDGVRSHTQLPTRLYFLCEQ